MPAPVALKFSRVQGENKRVEVVEVRRVVATNLHGAFSEWETQACYLTRCENYLYSLSINLGPVQGPLTRNQYFDYVAPVKAKLGLPEQPRAIVFHQKNNREHAHLIRLDLKDSARSGWTQTADYSHSGHSVGPSIEARSPKLAKDYDRTANPSNDNKAQERIKHRRQWTWGLYQSC